MSTAKRKKEVFFEKASGKDRIAMLTVCLQVCVCVCARVHVRVRVCMYTSIQSMAAKSC